MNLAELVREASLYKFGAQGTAYFPHGYRELPSLDQLQGQIKQLTPGTFCMVIDRVDQHPTISVTGFRLVECIVFEGQLFYLTAIRDDDSTINLSLLPQESTLPVTGISVSLICNDVPMYIEFRDRCIDHYVKELTGLDYEVCVAFFAQDGEQLRRGPKLGAWSFSERVHHRWLDRDTFHMGYARDQSLSLCSKSHVLMIDLDVFLLRQEVEQLMSWIEGTNGVINFCKPMYPFKGNGLYFGERVKLVSNGHFKGFKGFFFEDTEFLMNLSRTGSVPWCYFVDFKHIDDHPRHTTRGWFPHNQKAFEAILKQGHR